MSKVKTVFRCGACGADAPKWLGRCPGCGEWNTMAEEAAVPARPGDRSSIASVPAVAVELGSISTVEHQAVATGIAELDRVLGGGLTPGSVTLLGGEPGIGKSTLVLQLCASYAATGRRCLVVTGEESVEQVARRAERLGALAHGVLLVAETNLETILATIEEVRPSLVIIDSIQTMFAAGIPSAAGTVSQVRECAQAVTLHAKANDVAVLMVGHVTKEGALAGPRALEHVVDTVLEFEGDRHHGLRFLRSVKHRFGATDEVGVLEMVAEGLRGVPDASSLFLDDRRPGVTGSVVAPVLHGRRPLLVEIQALVGPSPLPQPRRVAQGLDGGRFAVVLAVLSRRAGVQVGKDDVYASVIGGVRVDEPAADLALALAVASSARDAPLPEQMVAVGELGLAGEVRRASHLEKRLAEAARLGFTTAIVPKGSPDGPAGLDLLRVGTLQEAMRVLHGGTSRAARA